MDIEAFASRSAPVPWQGAHKIPWSDPEFSARMLAEHLDQSHDMASRRLAVIDEQVGFLEDRVLGAAPGRVLDLGCGPGLYCAAFSRRGHRAVGIDFSPAAIEHATAVDTASSYRLADVRTADLGTGFDLVLMSFGEFNAFGPGEAAALLERMHAAAFPGGTVVLEVHNERAISDLGNRPASWRALSTSVFSGEPHLWLDEHFWYPDQLVAVARYYIVTADAAVTEYVNTLQGYRDHEYIELLQSTGFRRIGRFPSLTDDLGLLFLVAGT